MFSYVPEGERRGQPNLCCEEIRCHARCCDVSSARGRVTIKGEEKEVASMGGVGGGGGDDGGLGVELHQMVMRIR